MPRATKTAPARRSTPPVRMIMSTPGRHPKGGSVQGLRRCYAAPPRGSGARIRCGGGPERRREIRVAGDPSGGRPERRRETRAAADPSGRRPERRAGSGGRRTPSDARVR